MDEAIRNANFGYLMHSTKQDGYYVINMANSIIGVSILAMPWCFAKVGIILATLLLVSGGILTRISCNNLLDASVINRQTGYEYLALISCGKWAKLAVEMSTIGYLLGVCIAFLVTMADLLTPVASRCLHIPESTNFRAVLLVMVTLLIALPLSLIQKIENLSSLSALSIAFYVILACKVALDAIGENMTNNEINTQHLTLWRPENFLAVFPIFATGLSCQTQVFVMYDTLAEPSPSRMKHIIADAINLCTLLYLSMGLFGYMAFSLDGVQGDVLLNLEESLLSDTVKILYAVTVAISFPLCIFPCRRSLETLLFFSDSLDAVKSDDYAASLRRSRMTTCLLVLMTLIASLVVPDIETILNLSGGTMGGLICFILPAVIIFRTESLTSKGLSRFSVRSSWVILIIGLLMLAVCLYEVIFVALMRPWLWAFSSSDGPVIALDSLNVPKEKPFS